MRSAAPRTLRHRDDGLDAALGSDAKALVLGVVRVGEQDLGHAPGAPLDVAPAWG
jgi:hypothetical protein